MPIDPNIALQFRPTTPLAPPPNALESLARVLQIKNLTAQQPLIEGQQQLQQQQVQEGGLHLQDLRRAQQEQDAIKGALNDAGGDVEKAIPNILKVAPATGIKFVTALRQQQEAEFKAKGEQLRNSVTSAELGGRLLQGVADASDPAHAYQAALPLLKSMGVDITQMSPEYDPEEVKQHIASALTTKDKLQRADEELKNQIARNKEARDAALFPPQKRTAEATAIKDEAEAAIKQQEVTAPRKTTPGTPEQQFIEEFRQKNPKASIAEAQRAYAQNTHIAGPDAGIAALDRESSRFAKPHEKSLADATAQLEKIADARAMINGSAEAQALGIPKVLTALVSGQGSGVRITQPELNAIGQARGITGTVEGFVNSVSGQGKLTDTQKKQLTQILDDVQARIEMKRGIANDALDKINGARSRDEIVRIDKETRARLSDLETRRGSTSATPTAAGPPAGAKVQRNSATGQIRWSTDEGKTWQTQ